VILPDAYHPVYVSDLFGERTMVSLRETTCHIDPTWITGAPFCFQERQNRLYALLLCGLNKAARGHHRRVKGGPWTFYFHGHDLASVFL